ncbi:barwin-like endoglucanase [Trametopsis cervina]|nr:barwin-like endoglucanase [Trametopsis cervina]
MPPGPLATWFNTGLGACGINSNDAQFVVAISQSLYDTWPGYSGGNPNNNPVCGRSLIATYQGRQVTATVVDRCTGCAVNDIDFSPAAFSQLADLSVGRLHGVSWEIV